MKKSAGEIAELLGGSVDGDAAVILDGMAGLREAGAGDISFLANPRYGPMLKDTGAGAVVVDESCDIDSPAVLIRVKDPDAAFAKLAGVFIPPSPAPLPGIDPSAAVSPDASIGENVTIGPLAVISAGAGIGAGSRIDAGAFIGENVIIGRDGHIYPNVSILDRSELGDRVIIHSGTVIGSDGFGYTTGVDENGVISVEKIPQAGIVSIGNDVEIGSNVSIDRARFGKTRIGNSVKIDNLVQVAHNVKIGDYSGIVAHASLAGSCEIGSGVIVWGHAAVAGHIRVGDGAQVGGMSGVTKDVPPGAFVFGLPAVSKREVVVRAASIKQVPKLKKRIKELESRLESLEGAITKKGLL